MIMKTTNLMTTKIQPLVFILALLISAPMFGQDYFEGEIEYKISYESLSRDVSASSLIALTGDKHWAYVKEDKFITIFESKKSIGTVKILVRLDEGYRYVMEERSDTIEKYRIDISTDKLISLKKDYAVKKEVLGELCSSITVIYEMMNGGESIGIKKNTYYYSPKYPLNPERYLIYRQGYWDRYAELARAFSIRNEVEYEDQFRIISEAVSIEEKSIPDSVFELDPNKVIKIMDE